MRQEIVAIDPNRPSLKSIRDLNCRIQVLSMNTCGKTVKRLMRLFQNILNILKLGDRDNRSKDFFLHNFHFLVDVGENGGLNEITFLAVTFTAECDFGTLLLAGFDVVHDPGKLEFGDLRALDCLLVKGVADDILLCFGGEFCNEFVVDAFLYVNSGPSAATLA